MTQACCPGCGLRFAAAAAAYLVACPECGGPPQRVPSAEHVLGFRLAADSDCSDALPHAVAVATPIHGPGPDAVVTD
jgi:predicted  nucleic acid-binding Zn-ribbon protein